MSVDYASIQLGGRPATAGLPSWKKVFWFVCAAAFLSGMAQASTSVFATAPADPYAITVAGRGDGKADDSQAIQLAIDKAAKFSGGIVFLPSGHYRISRTILIWPGVRIYGTGAERPVLVLKDHTPGFQRGIAHMVVFAGAPRLPNPAPFPPSGVVPFDPKILDGHEGTFYSSMSNIDVEIGAGNQAAAAIRFRVAQHAILSHMDMRLGSAFAGVYQGGNVIRDVHFHGGRYGLVTEKTPPTWPFLVIDTTFDGQRDAAIREHEAGLTLVNVTMRNVPVGIEIDKGYSDQLWGKDVRFEQVRQAAIVISNENNPFTQIGFDNALAADTPIFARFRESGRTVSGKGNAYRVTAFNYGLSLPEAGQVGRYDTRADISALVTLPPERPQAIRALPPVSEWANARALGVAGDGKTDDTAALQRAIDTHRAVYLPAGFYKVTDTIRLRPDSVLIGLHPALTQIVLPSNTPAYQGAGGPKALVQTASGGDAIVTGLGLFTGGVNPRATGLLWTAGENSLLDDVRFFGRNGTDLAQAQAFPSVSANRFGDYDPAQRLGGQYPSLWVTNGGGGTFNAFWSPDSFADAGFYISDTKTPGHVYQASVEHHARTEIVMHRVSNWELLAPQTEEEFAESRNAISFEISDCSNILIANYRAYRVTRTSGPVVAAVQLFNAHDIRFRNVHMNAEHGYKQCDEGGCITYLRANKYPFENSIHDMTHGAWVRDRQFAVLDVTGGPPAAVTPKGIAVRKLADGFEAIGGAVLDSRGTLYFTDRIAQRIYSWSEDAGLNIASDHTLDPVNLAVDSSDNLMVLSSAGVEGTVFSLKPGGLPSVITATPAGAHPRASIAMPANWWIDGQFKDQYDPAHNHFTTLAEMFARDAAAAPRKEYVSPDGSLVLPAFRTVHQGPPDFRGWRFSHALDAYGFTIAHPGERIYVSHMQEAKTYSAKLGQGGALSDLKVFANRAGESVVTDASGRVYIANGQVFVYAPDGRELGRIDVPQRPLQVVSGRRNLFVLTNVALYSADLAEVPQDAGQTAQMRSHERRRSKAH
jgi:sugar lactone lactonase YvrE